MWQNVNVFQIGTYTCLCPAVFSVFKVISNFQKCIVGKGEVMVRTLTVQTWGPEFKSPRLGDRDGSLLVSWLSHNSRNKVKADKEKQLILSASHHICKRANTHKTRACTTRPHTQEKSNKIFCTHKALRWQPGAHGVNVYPGSSDHSSLRIL